MSPWIGAVYPILIALLLLFLPGAVLLAALGVRSRVGWAAAPVVSVAVISVSAVLFGIAGIPWGPAGVLLSTLALGVVAFGVRILVRRRTAEGAGPLFPRPHVSRPVLAALGGGLLISAVSYLVQFVRPSGSPENYGQLQDTMFHFNVVRYILDTGIGSSTRVGAMDGSVGGSPFYPSAWHDTVALIVQLSGSSIPVAVAAITTALLVVVWPLGLMALARTLFGAQPLLIGLTGALAGAVGAFPWRFLSWGVLYSNQFAMSLLPAFIALIVLLASHRGRPRAEFWYLIGLLPLMLAGLALAQPNTVFGVAVYLAPLAFPLIWRWTAGPDRAAHRRRFTLIAAGYVLAATVAWLVVYNLPFMQRTVTWVWPPFQTLPQAVGEVLVSGFNGNLGQLVFAALLLVGLVWALRDRRQLWFAASYLVFAVLYILSSSSTSTLRDILTGFWYHDSFRLAAFTALASIPLSALGLHRLLLLARPVGLRLLPRRANLLPALGAVGVAALLAANLLSPGMHTQRSLIRGVFAADPGYMLSPAETRFLQTVAAEVPKNELIANNPYDGSALGYAFFDSRFLFPAMDGNWLGTWGSDQLTVARGLNTIASTPAVCRAAQNLSVRYLVQLEPRLYSKYGEEANWAGLRVTDSTPGFTLLRRDGESALYRVNAC